MQQPVERAWQRPEMAKEFVDNVRAAIPLAAEQIDVLLRLVQHALPSVERILDLGCGDGILGRTVLANYPKASGVFLDFSEPMIETARQRVDAKNVAFVVEDLASKHWVQAVAERAPFDLVVSGLAIHHLPDERKRELYAEIFGLLKPGGLFLHLERVTVPAAWAEEAYHEMFIDSLWSHQHESGGTMTRDAIAEKWRQRTIAAEDLPAPVDLQCQWLETIGFVDVDCFFKLFALALFGGRKPLS